MSLNNIRAVGDDRQWKDEVERELKSLLEIIKYGKITIRSAGAVTGGGGGGGGGAGADAISAVLPATYDNTTYVVGVDQDAFDHIANLGYAQFDTTVATGTFNDVGLLTWNDTDGTLEFGLKGGLVTLQIGQEQVMRVRNNTGSTLNEGTVCYFSGSNGVNFNVVPALATGDATSAQTMGVLTETLNTSSTQHGFLTTFGLVRGIDLSYIAGLADGDQLYLDGTTAGRMTKTKPAAPTHLVYVGICLSAAGSGSNSTIFVKVQNGYELDEIHDVKITGPIANNEVLAYTSATSLWENKTAAEASLLTTSATLDSLADVVITTPATDQVVKYNGTNWVNAAAPGGGGGTVTSITAGTGLSASPASPITTSGTLNVTDAALNPPGIIMAYGGTTAPNTGWLICNGGAYSRTTYAALFAVIGTSYGAGDGSTTFNVPDLRGRFPVGADGGAEFTANGTSGGNKTHSHTLSNAGYAKGSRSGNRFVYAEVSPVPTWTAVNEILGTGAASTATRTFGIALGGSTDATTGAESLPPYLVFRYIIKT